MIRARSLANKPNFQAYTELTILCHAIPCHFFFPLGNDPVLLQRRRRPSQRQDDGQGDALGPIFSHFTLRNLFSIFGVIATAGWVRTYGRYGWIIGQSFRPGFFQLKKTGLLDLKPIVNATKWPIFVWTNSALMVQPYLLGDSIRASQLLTVMLFLAKARSLQCLPTSSF